MKIIVFFFLIIGFNVTFFLNPIIAQVSFYPRSLLEDNKLLLKNDDELVVYSTSIPNKDSLLSIEEILNQDGKIRPQLYGRAFNVNINFSNSGTWDTLSNGDRIWRLRVVCPDAYCCSGSSVIIINETNELKKENSKYQKGVIL